MVRRRHHLASRLNRVEQGDLLLIFQSLVEDHIEISARQVNRGSDERYAAIDVNDPGDSQFHIFHSLRESVLLPAVALPEVNAIPANDTAVWQYEDIIFRTVTTPAMKTPWHPHFHF